VKHFPTFIALWLNNSSCNSVRTFTGITALQ